MIKNFSNMFFFFILINSTLIVITSNSWLSIWMGLEINLMSFIPLMMSDNNLISSESSIKYFLVQALASTIILFMIIFYFMFFNFLNNFFMIYFNIIIMASGLLTKMGAAPFHFWFPMVTEGLNWWNNLILMTWQKLAPLISLSYLKFNNLFFLITMMCVILGALGGLNQTSLRKILTYSSINHMGWMICIMNFNEMILMLYFLIYFLLSFLIIFILNLFKLFYFNQLFYNFINNNLMKFFLFMNLLSLGGLPPFMGFISKWMIIQTMIFFNKFILIIMIMCSLLTLFFYLRLTFSVFFINYNENSWNYKSSLNNFITNFSIIISFIFSFSLLFINLIFIFM